VDRRHAFATRRSELLHGADTLTWRGYVIDQGRNPKAFKIAHSDDDKMARIRKITDAMRDLQEQKNEALR
jgi:hypothetical protein